MFYVEGTPHEVIKDWATGWFRVVLQTEKIVRIPTTNYQGIRYLREITNRTKYHISEYFKNKIDLLLFLGMVVNNDVSPYAMGWSL